MSTAQDLLGEAGTCKECRDLGGPCPRHREVVFGTILERFRTDENAGPELAIFPTIAPDVTFIRAAFGEPQPRREGEGGEA